MQLYLQYPEAVLNIGSFRLPLFKGLPVSLSAIDVASNSGLTSTFIDESNALASLYLKMKLRIALGPSIAQASFF